MTIEEVITTFCIIGIIGLCLIFSIFNKKRVEKLNKKYYHKGIRTISSNEIVTYIILNIIFCILFYFIFFVLYILIYIGLGIINENNELFELDTYTLMKFSFNSFIPLEFLDKLNHSGIVLGAFILSQISCIISERLSIFDVENIQKESRKWCELISIGVNIILWIVTPFSIIISIIFFNIIFGINLKIFKIKIKIPNKINNE